MTSIFFSVVLLFFSCGANDKNPTNTDGMNEIEARALQLINNHRSSKGLPPLKHNKFIFDAARAHSANMAEKKVPFGHEGFAQRINNLRTQLSFGQAGENVAFNHSNTPAVTVVQQWLKSKGHRKNIENKNYTLCGLAVVRSAQNIYYFTHIFAAE